MDSLVTDTDLADIAVKVTQGERLSEEEGLRLLRTRHLAALGALANLVRDRLHGDRTYYIINRHLNYTNICVNGCRFSAFSRKEGEPGGYLLSVEECLAKAEAFRGGRVSEFHLVGGCHPSLRIEYYQELLSALHARYPDVHLQAFTAVEIAHVAQLSGMSVHECLTRLRGGGARVSAWRRRGSVRRSRAPGVVSAEALG